MLDVIRENKRIAQVILGLLVVPLAFFGGWEMFTQRDKGVATVGNIAISPAQLNDAYNNTLINRRERNPEMPQPSPEEEARLKREMLDYLIDQTVLGLFIQDTHLVGDGALRAELGKKFGDANSELTQGLYERLLRSREGADVRAQLSESVMNEFLTEAAIVPEKSLSRILEAQFQTRTLRELRFPIERHLVAVQIDDAAIQNYYDSHPEMFVVPERVKAEYIVLEPALTREITEDEIKKTYDDSVKLLPGAEGVPPFSEVRDEIVSRLKKQLRAKVDTKYTERVSRLSEFVWSESNESLAPAAREFGLELRHTDWISVDEERFAGYGGHKARELIGLLFDDVKEKRNTRAVDLDANVWVSGRVLEYQPKIRRPLAEVKDQIVAALKREAALKLAVAEGEAVGKALDKGEASSQSWSDARAVERYKAEVSRRDKNAPLPVQAIAPVFSASAAKLPVRVGVILPDAYVIYQIEKVETPKFTDDDPRLAAERDNYKLLVAQRDFRSLIQSMRRHYKLKINKLPE